MTVAKKVSLALLAVLCAFAFAAGVLCAFSWGDKQVAQAEQATNDAIDQSNYYGHQLTDSVAIKFYKALESLAPQFVTGNASQVVEGSEIEQLAVAYTEGDKQLLDLFGAARDCFYYDHSEYFYVDFDYLTLNVALKNGQYVVSIGPGRSDTYFKKGLTAESVNSAVVKYNLALDAAVEKIQAQIDQANATWQASVDTSDVVKFINDFVCDRIVYGFCQTATGADTENSAYIRTTYGALVVGQCVCEGYARLFKTLCDKFDVKCVLIYGGAINANGGTEPHMWNAVLDDDEKWYAVDCTFNDILVDGIRYNDYLMVTGTYLSANHFADPVISSSNYALGYPELASVDISMPSNKLEAFFAARTVDGRIGNWLAISYGGMNYNQLKATGLYMAVRVKYESQWSPWMSYDACVNAGIASQTWYHSGTYSYYFVAANTRSESIEVGIFDAIDDMLDPNKKPVCYSDEFAEQHLVEKSTEIPNESFNEYYVSPAFVKSVEYSYQKDGKTITGTNFQTSMQEIGYEYTITVTYTQKLKMQDESQDVGITYTVSQLDGFRTTDLSTVYENSNLKDFAWDQAANKITFKFTPSPLYQHNKIWYKFSLTNLVNAPTGDKQVGVAPNTFGTLWGYTDTYICTKCLGGGRYLLDNVYSQPTLVSDGDLATENWTYKDSSGTVHKVSESQRSNMALVVTSPTGAVADNIAANIDNAVCESAGSSAQVLASKTYEIDLQICGAIVTIPNGSYLKIKLGYPTGYDYNSLALGTTFKLYHFKRDASGNLNYAQPEVVDCVFTEQGIIALVESFSPYTLVAISGAETDNTRSLTTKFDGVGGQISSDAEKSLVHLAPGQSVTYTLKAYTGYEIDYVLLNGSPVEVRDGVVQISYDSLMDSAVASTLNVGFVSSTVKQAQQADTSTVDLSLAYISNAAMENSVVVDASNAQATAQAVSTAANAMESNISGQVQTISAPAVASASQQAVQNETKFGTMVFDSDGGSAVQSVTAVAGEKVQVPSNPTREGYEFLGWTDEQGRLYTIDTMPEGNVTLKASWKALEGGSTGSVTDTSNDGSGSQDGHKNNTTLIVILVVEGVAVLVALVIILIAKSRKKKAQK